MTEQTNAELIVDARQLGRHSIVSTPEHANMLGRLAAALEASGKKAAELAAVVEKVREWIAENRPIKCTYVGTEEDDADILLSLLATTPADALRELKADVWASGYNAGYSDRSTPGEPFTRNPYKEEQS